MKMRTSVLKCSSCSSFFSFNSNSRLSVATSCSVFCAQHLGNGHFDGAIVLDHHDAAGDGDFAIGEGVKRVHQLLRAHAAGRAHFDLRLARR